MIEQVPGYVAVSIPDEMARVWFNEDGQCVSDGATRIEAVIRMPKTPKGHDAPRFLDFVLNGDYLGECPDWEAVDKVLVPGQTYRVAIEVRPYDLKENANA